MAANYVLLEKVVVGAAGAAVVTFSNIPQTGYTDLIVKTSAKETNNSGVLLCKINGTTTGYTGNEVQGSGSAAASNTNYVTANGFGPEGSLADSNGTVNTFSNNEYYFPNYTSASYKSISVDATIEKNATTIYMALGAYLWSNTAAITTLAFQPYNSTAFVQYTTFYLYGVAKLGTTPAIVPYATGGDTIMTDGTYWYDTFLSSGTFTPQKALSVDYLVVAGGGGGGRYAGGGGGAGGFKTATGFSCASGTGVTVTIGGGGAGASANGAGTSGSNSVFSSITSTGGGGGGGNTVGVAGGSGGGGSGLSTNAGGAASPAGQGNAGGAGTNGAAGGGAGGGGASAAGTNGAASGENGGAGGAGTANSYSGSSVTYAGGGGGAGGGSGAGGAGGTGGGGAGGSNAGAGVAATANTGGGGGGNWSGLTGGNGGSGIVLVRYAV